MASRLPIPAVGTEAYRQWRRSEGAYAPRAAEPSISDLSAAMDRRLGDLMERVLRLPEPAPAVPPAPRVSAEVDVTDPGWFLRHEDWLRTEAGRAYTADQARPVAVRMAEIRSEHRAEQLRDARQADARTARGQAHQIRPSMGGKFSLGV